MSKKAGASLPVKLFTFVLKYVSPYRRRLILALSTSLLLMALQVYGAV